jgi:excisionase family DNA binding protein
MNDEILTVLEVAALLKVADKTVYTMAQQGEFPAFKVRGQEYLGSEAGPPRARAGRSDPSRGSTQRIWTRQRKGAC